jgi:hypothetical protein
MGHRAGAQARTGMIEPREDTKITPRIGPHERLRKVDLGVPSTLMSGWRDRLRRSIVAMHKEDITIGARSEVIAMRTFAVGFGRGKRNGRQQQA